MHFKENLDDLRKKINQELGFFLDDIIREAYKKDKFVADALKLVKKNILAGGKRIRPILMYWGYWGAGGRDEKKIIKTAISIELIHTFLLIHDDIMDRDVIRHGKPTVNAAYEKIGKKSFSKKDNQHFGNSIAIIIGDMVAALGNQIIFESSFAPKLIMKALSKMQDIVSLTVIGQAKDIYMEYSQKAKEKDVLEMYEYKTAKYTLEGPLQLGGILAGASEDILASYSNFSIPLGIAFQIQDDILGVFGSEKEIGKTVGSDISEGKRTILVVKALEKARTVDKKKLLNLLGKEKISSKEIELFRDILVKTGSLEYAQQLAKKMALRAKREIGKIAINQETKKFLLELSDYFLDRKC